MSARANRDTYVAGMRESSPALCWRLLDGGSRCCILDRGHDGGVHEEGGSGYQIALTYDDLGLDDVVVKDVEMFRMERMDYDYVWLACYLRDGQEIVFDLRLGDEATIVYSAREPLPNVAYREGSRRD